MEKFVTSNVIISNGNIEYPIGISIFAVNLPLKPPAAVANAEIGSLKSILTLYDKYLNHMLVKFELNSMVQTLQNCDIFDKKLDFENNFRQSVDAILEDVSVNEQLNDAEL